MKLKQSILYFKECEENFVRLTEAVARIYLIKPSDIYKRSREKRYVESRFIVIALSRVAFKLPNSTLAREFMITNASIINARRKVSQYYKFDINFRAVVNYIIEQHFNSDPEIIDALLRADDGNLFEAHFYN